MSSETNFRSRLLYRDGQPVDIKDVWFLAIAHDAYHFCFQVPLEKCIWGYGWRYTQDENPFYYAYQQSDNLDRFYRYYQPKSALEALTFEPEHGGWESLYIPWRCTIKPAKPTIVEPFFEGVGTQHFGPVSSEKLELEKTRLQTVMTSIQTVGYQGGQGEHEHIRGYFMVHDDDFVFYIAAGKHRAAALLRLGYTCLPATFSVFVPRLPRLISHRHLQLLAGTVYDSTLLPTVYQIFEGYFDTTLRQKRISMLKSWLNKSQANH